MKRAEFERLTRVYRGRQAPAIAQRYVLSRPDERYILHRREIEVLRLLRRHGVADLTRPRILDLGGGRGHRLADWVRWGAGPDNLSGIDIMEAFAREAAKTVPGACIAVASGDQMPFAPAYFDIVVQSMVFSSVLDPLSREQMAAEMLRVAKPGGLILWYDFRIGNPRNPDLRPVRRNEIARLFPGCAVDLRSMTLVPPFARALGRSAFWFGPALEAFPFLRTHYLAAIRKV